MTFQPAKSNFLANLITAVLVLQIVGGAAWLVVLYNRVVDLTHGASRMRQEIQMLEAKNAEYKGKIFSLFSSDKLEQFAADRGLIKEGNPQYLEIVKQWVSASGY